MKRALSSLLLAIVALCALPASIHAASMAATDINEGYGGKVLTRLNSVWAPPDLRGEFQLKIKIAVDGQGKVADCAVVKSSGVEALDTSACGAVRQIGKFDAPPYGAPCEIHLAYWTGVPKGNAKEMPDPQKALRAEVIARDKSERAAGKQRADATEERAREQAEQAAKRTGKNLPEIQPHPVDKTASKSQSPPAGQPAAPDKPASQSAPNESAKSPSASLNAEEMRLVMGNKTKDVQKKAEAAPAAPQQKASPPAASARRLPPENYRKTIQFQLLNAIIVPKEVKPGSYETVVRLRINNDGTIAGREIVESSGDKLLDRYVLSGIGRAGKLPPPPAELGNPVDLTLILKRR